MKKEKTKATKKTPKENAYSSFRMKFENVSRISNPTIKFEIGQSVKVGNLFNCKIDEILEDGKVLCVSYESKDGTGKLYVYEIWPYVKPINEIVDEVDFTTNEDIRLNFLQQDVSAILHYYYNAGINMNPYYQRDYVWDSSDKENLLESVFMNAEIGKVILNRNSDRIYYETGYSADVVDGKQRISTLVDFFENRFSYKGKFYNDLSKKDKMTFLRTPLALAILDGFKEKDILRTFVMVNRGGKKMDEIIIDNAIKMMNALPD